MQDHAVLVALHDPRMHVVTGARRDAAATALGRLPGEQLLADLERGRPESREAQVAPAEALALLDLDRPEHAAELVEVGDRRARLLAHDRAGMAEEGGKPPAARLRDDAGGQRIRLAHE